MSKTEYKIHTEDNLEYSLFPDDSGFFEFRVKAKHDAHIALCSQGAEVEPMYEVFIGGWGNSKSIIRKDKKRPDVAEVPTPNIISADEFRGFWIRFNNGSISVGREREDTPFLSWVDPDRVPIENLGVSTGRGATGDWIINPSNTGNGRWVKASEGQVPPNSFNGGQDADERLYVIRVNYNDALIPGKLLRSHGTAYIAWGGLEKSVNEYEVLCDFTGEWLATQGGSIPPNALPAGRSEDGETLYIGRVEHNDTLTIGKVQPSHGVVSIPYGGKEETYSDYQILCS